MPLQGREGLIFLPLPTEIQIAIPEPGSLVSGLLVFLSPDLYSHVTAIESGSLLDGSTQFFEQRGRILLGIYWPRFPGGYRLNRQITVIL